MSPFKEPQPRKNSAAEDAKTVIGGNWPPYAREGGEANWEAKPSMKDTIAQVVTDVGQREAHAKAREVMEEWKNTPLMVLPDHSPFELRKAALEAACAIQRDGRSSAMFWDNIELLETYLRDGTRPS